VGTFPVIDSTLSAEHLSSWIIERYHLSDIVHCRLFRTNMNHTYFVTTPDKKYVLRVYSHDKRTETEITEEIGLLNLLKEKDILVSYPISDRENKYVQKIDAPEGMRYAVLFSFGEGNKMRFLTEELCREIGKIVAKMHQTTQNKSIDRIRYDIRILAEQPYRQTQTYFPESLEAMKFIKGSTKLLNTVFNGNQIELLRSGIVHLDVWYDNMSIDDEGRITLFDFDNCGNGWLILDVGYFCMQLFYVEHDRSEYEKKRAAFLDGYGKIFPFQDEELALIPYAGLSIWIYYLGLQAERFDNFANIFFTENYLKMYIGRVKEWLCYHDIEVKMG